MTDNRRVAYTGSPIYEAHEKFRFACHPGLPCYNQCCRDIDIYLSPYDVLRMKKRLQITSGEFLQTYTSRVTSRSGLHFVQLDMRPDDLKCPFVTPEGCKIYSDRPWSCRLAPIEVTAQGRYYFIFSDRQCLGMRESTEWTVETWKKDQGLLIYDELEAVFRELPASVRFTGMPTLDRHVAEMYFMACYDVDRFRQFVFGSDFLKEYRVPDALAERMRTNDVELMKYAFNWLAEGLDVAKTIDLRDQAF